jgi:hypothetical protein
MHMQHVLSLRTPGGADKFREKGVLHLDELTLCFSIFIKIFRGSERHLRTLFALMRCHRMLLHSNVSFRLGAPLLHTH